MSRLDRPFPMRWLAYLTATAVAITATVAASDHLRNGAGWFVQPAVAREVAVQLEPIQSMVGLLVCWRAKGTPLLTDCILRSPDGQNYRVPLGDSAALIAAATTPAPTP